MQYKYYCGDNIKNVENYELAKADNFKGWHCHHRLETHNSDGERRLVDISHKELKALGMYYHRPAEELIFMTVVEHHSLHHRGKHCSEETKVKLSEAHKGKPSNHKGKTMSDESKVKMSAAHKGKRLSDEVKAKISAAEKGKQLSEETKKKISSANKGKNNPMYGQKHSEETRKKISAAKKGKHWKLVDGKRVFTK